MSAVLAVSLSPGAALAQDRSPPPRCQTLEGCYGYDGMLDFYNQVIALIDGFSQASYSAMPRPTYWYVRSGENKAIGCGSVATGAAFFYCMPDRTIYVGQDQLWDFYNLSGDGAAAFGVAHEWAHYVQDQRGVYSVVVDQVSYIRAENQADCIGGAFLRHLRDRNILEMDDYADVNTILPQIASAESDINRDHGTVAERARSVQYGFDNGLGSCSDFFPGVPLVT